MSFGQKFIFQFVQSLFTCSINHDSVIHWFIASFVIFHSLLYCFIVSLFYCFILLLLHRFLVLLFFFLFGFVSICSFAFMISFHFAWFHLLSFDLISFHLSPISCHLHFISLLFVWLRSIRFYVILNAQKSTIEPSWNLEQRLSSRPQGNQDVSSPNQPKKTNHFGNHVQLPSAAQLSSLSWKGLRFGPAEGLNPLQDWYMQISMN